MSAAVAPIAHGGQLIAARLLFPGAPHPFVDLSTGINPVPYPIPILPRTCFARLPEPEDVLELEAIAAVAYGVAEPAAVVAAPGAQSLIHLLPRLLPPGDVAVLGPTYAEHAAAWLLGGHLVREVVSLDAAMAARIVVLCNPNNPDGRRVAPPVLRDAATRLAGRGGLLVVDEAFCDFEPALSVADAVPMPGLVALRSFGKAYGLPGLRLGFALAEPAWAARIRAALGPWAVAGPSIQVARAALADRAWLAAAGRRLAEEAGRLDGLLADAGFAVVGGTCLYRLAAHKQAASMFERLGRAGILARRFPERPDWLRLGIPGSPAIFDRLAQALSHP